MNLFHDTDMTQMIASQYTLINYPKLAILVGILAPILALLEQIKPDPVIDNHWLPAVPMEHHHRLITDGVEWRQVAAHQIVAMG